MKVSGEKSFSQTVTNLSTHISFIWTHGIEFFLTSFSLLQRKLRNCSPGDAQRNGHQICSEISETSTSSCLLGEADSTWDRCADAQRQFRTDRKASRCVRDAQWIHSHSWDVSKSVKLLEPIKLISLLKLIGQLEVNCKQYWTKMDHCLSKRRELAFEKF